MTDQRFQAYLVQWAIRDCVTSHCFYRVAAGHVSAGHIWLAEGRHQAAPYAVYTVASALASPRERYV